MYKYIFLLSALTICGFSYELDCLTGTAIEQCINCICYAKTGTWDIHLCGRRLITLAYWRTSGSLSTSSSWRPLVAWKSCREDANCILNSIKRFTEQFGNMDCNLDGEFNCQDRFGIQIHRRLCVNRRVSPVIFNRFHSCLPNVETYENRERNNYNGFGLGGNNYNGLGSGGNNYNGLGSGGNNQDALGSGGNNHDALGSGGNNHDALGSGGNNHDALGSGGNSHDALGSGGNNHDGLGLITNNKQDVEVIVEQDVNGLTNKAEQDVEVKATQNSGGSANQEVKVVVEQKA